jgi:hypothetical protein
MSTQIHLLAIGGMAMHLPLLVLVLFLRFMPRQDGPHAGNAALALALPLLVCLALAVLGFIANLAAAIIWAQTRDPLQSPGLGWIGWSCVALALLWIVGGSVILLFPRADG